MQSFLIFLFIAGFIVYGLTDAYQNTNRCDWTGHDMASYRNDIHKCTKCGKEEDWSD